jgi:flavin reductase (DIM6/NTAB) family NADH-FMN oxidoreductase RutF
MDDGAEGRAVLAPAEIDRRFVAALRTVASTVTIVTTGALDAHPHAMTATSFTSVSVEPATLLVCVNRNARMHAALQAQPFFCVNALRPHHQPLAVACSTPGSTARFAPGVWERGVDGLPYLPDAQAVFFCRKIDQIEIGSHSILLGEVTALQPHAQTDPLLYADRQFFSLQKLP